MTVVIILVVLFGLLHLPGLRTARAFRETVDKLSWALGVTLLVTASSHFLTPETLVAMMPPFLPAPMALVYISGVAEAVIALGLMVHRTRRPAALAAIALLVAVFPANIYAAVSGAPISNYPESPLYRWLRLPMQFLLIAWACWVYRRADE